MLILEQPHDKGLALSPHLQSFPEEEGVTKLSLLLSSKPSKISEEKPVPGAGGRPGPGPAPAQKKTSTTPHPPGCLAETVGLGAIPQPPEAGQGRQTNQVPLLPRSPVSPALIPKTRGGSEPRTPHTHSHRSAQSTGQHKGCTCFHGDAICAPQKNKTEQETQTRHHLPGGRDRWWQAGALTGRQRKD